MAYDFSRCKLCGYQYGKPLYRLQKCAVYCCTSCDFHYLDCVDTPPANPLPADEPLDDASWNFIECRIGASLKHHRSSVRAVAERCPIATSRFLDIGAGAGAFLALLSREGAAVWGIEPQQPFRTYAQRKFGLDLHGETVDHPLWQGSYSGFFDVITLWDVLEHVNFPAETIENAATVTKPGGWLFLDTPSRDALFYRASELAYRLSGGRNTFLLQSIYSPAPFRHKQIFTNAQLLQLVQRAGYDAVRVQRQHFSLSSRILLIARKRHAR